MADDFFEKFAVAAAAPAACSAVLTTLTPPGSPLKSRPKPPFQAQSDLNSEEEVNARRLDDGERQSRHR
jgi:hypothetical protein